MPKEPKQSNVDSLAWNGTPTLLEAPHEVTQSAVGMFLSCPMKYFFRYRLGLTPRRVSKNLAIGAAVHAGFEASMKEWQRGCRTAAIIATAQDAVHETFEAFFNDEHALTNEIEDPCSAEGVAAAAITGWWQLILKTGFPFGNILQVETYTPATPAKNLSDFHKQEYSHMLNRMSGKVDMVIQNESGYAIVEHKTRSGFGVYDWTHFLTMDLQALWYVTLLNRGKSEDHPQFIKYFWYNGIAKDAHRTPKDYLGLLRRRLEYMNEEPSKYFFIKEVYVDELMQAHFRNNLFLIMRSLFQANETLQFIWNPKACDSYSASCPYRKLCANGCDMKNFREVCNSCDWSSTLRIEAPNIELFQLAKESE